MPGLIVDGIRNILVDLFIPSEDFYTDKVDELKSDFGFANSISESVASIQTSITAIDNDSAIPSIKIDLGSAQSYYGFNYGGTYYITFNWFAPYRNEFIALVSSILWIFFIWRTYKNLPNIINGISGAELSVPGSDVAEVK